MQYLHEEHPYFDCERFEKEVFNNGTKDPFHQRLRDIRSWDDVPYYSGLSPQQVEKRALKDGFMSQKLYEFFEKKLGRERLSGYFTEKSAPKKTKEQQEEEDLITMMFGNVSDYSRLRLHRLGKGNK